MPVDILSSDVFVRHIPVLSLNFIIISFRRHLSLVSNVNISFFLILSGFIFNSILVPDVIFIGKDVRMNIKIIIRASFFFHYCHIVID